MFSLPLQSMQQRQRFLHLKENILMLTFQRNSTRPEEWGWDLLSQDTSIYTWSAPHWGLQPFNFLDFDGDIVSISKTIWNDYRAQISKTKTKRQTTLISLIWKEAWWFNPPRACTGVCFQIYFVGICWARPAPAAASPASQHCVSAKNWRGSVL